ncbi:hypothetical protein [Nostoc sp.]
MKRIPKSLKGKDQAVQVVKAELETAWKGDEQHLNFELLPDFAFHIKILE